MTEFTLLILMLFKTYHSSDWNYDLNGTDWHEHWPECGHSHQSPINLVINPSLCEKPLSLEWRSENESFAIGNNGHSLQAVPFGFVHASGSHLSGIKVLHHTNDTHIRLKNALYNTYKSPVNKEYCFDSLHFHWGDNNDYGSEHTINGQAYPLEVHLVHYSCDYYTNLYAQSAYTSGHVSRHYDDRNILGVISVLFELGNANPILEDILDDEIIEDVHKYHNPELRVTSHVLELYYTGFNLMDLLPSDKTMIAYEGSLTTPPCYETVRWNVMTTPMTVSKDQMDDFRSILKSTNENDTMAPNFRPVQDIADRVTYQCQEEVDAKTVTKDEVGIPSSGATGTECSWSDEMEIWFIVGIVFICLFIQSMIFLCWFGWKIYQKNNKDKKERKRYHQTGSKLHDDEDEHEEMQMTVND